MGRGVSQGGERARTGEFAEKAGCIAGRRWGAGYRRRGKGESGGACGETGLHRGQERGRGVSQEEEKRTWEVWR